MIPKIIHYCWLGNDPYPEKIQRCIDSWSKYLPDYEFVLWNKERFDIHSVPWVEQAYEAKKYALAADYIHAYALANYGGIYLDSDVEVLKSFDDLLDLPYFMGTERYALSGTIEAAVVGAVPHHPFYEKLLAHYDGREFIKKRKLRNEKQEYDMLPLPQVFKEVIAELGLKEKHIDGIDAFDRDEKTLCIFPVDYFSPKDNRTQRINKTKRTYAIHHFAGSWNSKEDKSFATRIHRLVGDKIYYACFSVPYFKLKDFIRARK